MNLKRSYKKSRGNYALEHPKPFFYINLNQNKIDTLFVLLDLTRMNVPFPLAGLLKS